MSVVGVGAGQFRPNLSGTGNARGEIDGRFGETLDGLMAKQENQDQWQAEKNGEPYRHSPGRGQLQGIRRHDQERAHRIL